MIPSTVELCRVFPTQTVFLEHTYPYAMQSSFAGYALVLQPRNGREALRRAIESDGAGRVCVIDGSANQDVSVFSRTELACAQAAKAKAVVVIGPVSDLGPQLFADGGPGVRKHATADAKRRWRGRAPHDPDSIWGAYGQAPDHL